MVLIVDMYVAIATEVWTVYTIEAEAPVTAPDGFDASVVAPAARFLNTVLGNVSPNAVLGLTPEDVDGKSQQFKPLPRTARAGVRRLLFQLRVDFPAKVEVSKVGAATATMSIVARVVGGAVASNLLIAATAGREHIEVVDILRDDNSALANGNFLGAPSQSECHDIVHTGESAEVSHNIKCGRKFVQILHADADAAQTSHPKRLPLVYVSMVEEVVLLGRCSSGAVSSKKVLDGEAPAGGGVMSQPAICINKPSQARKFFKKLSVGHVSLTMFVAISVACGQWTWILYIIRSDTANHFAEHESIRNVRLGASVAILRCEFG